MGEGGEGNGEATVDPDAAGEAPLWASYQRELMEGFPTPPKLAEEIQVPAEGDGQGVNPRAFYVTNELNEKWLLLPPLNPKQIRASRRIWRFLTGKRDTKVDSVIISSIPVGRVP